MNQPPLDLATAVHQALRQWYEGYLYVEPWTELLIVEQYLDQQPDKSLGDAHNRSVKEILLNGLAELDRQQGNLAAQILRHRFFDQETVIALANRFNRSENAIHHRQRAAINALAEILWKAEEKARAEKILHITERLEIKSPPQLFGISDKLTTLKTVLLNADRPWVVAVDGIGGIGKTTIADRAVRDILATPRFTDLVWSSARQENFSFWTDLATTAEPPPALSLEDLLDTIILQLGFIQLATLPLPSKKYQLAHQLKLRPYLIVIDNLETAADYRTLVPELYAFTEPSKFLLTSRYSLHEYPQVYCLGLNELSLSATVELLRHEAKDRGQHDLATAPDTLLHEIYAATGGNPLALKLVVGQAHTLSIPQILDNLRAARGKNATELYHFIYWNAWHLLSDVARRVLITMPLVSTSGGSWEQIAAATGLSETHLTEALKELVTLSLVNVAGNLHTRRYSIHRLTESFLLQEVVKWQQ